MTRIEGVTATRDAGPLVRLVYRLSRRELGRDVDPVGVYAHAPRPAVRLRHVRAGDRASSTSVDERLKVLAETKAAALVNCEFCCDIASSIAREAGITEAQLLALPDYRESERVHRARAARARLRDARSAARRRRVTDELFAALREHFDERQMVELTNVIALENMRARFNSAFEMTPAGFSEGMVCVRPESATARPARRSGPHEPPVDGHAGMRVFLAGATGAIGRPLVRAAARGRARGRRA